MKCSQCSKPAMYEVNGHLLCLDHHDVIVRNAQVAQQNNMAMMNYHKDQINEMFGLPPSSARIQIPQNVVNNSPITNNNITVSKSVVGSINTAQVGRINVAMEQIVNEGNENVSQAIKELTEATLNSTQADQELRDTLIEQFGFLAEQAALSEKQRQTSVIKMVLKSIPTAITVVTGIDKAWAKWGSILVDFFK